MIYLTLSAGARKLLRRNTFLRCENDIRIFRRAIHEGVMQFYAFHFLQEERAHCPGSSRLLSAGDGNSGALARLRPGRRRNGFARCHRKFRGLPFQRGAAPERASARDTMTCGPLAARSTILITTRRALTGCWDLHRLDCVQRPGEKRARATHVHD